MLYQLSYPADLEGIKYIRSVQGLTTTPAGSGFGNVLAYVAR